MTKIIGLTGGIGSGKSTIARFFEEQGVPVYIADDEAKKLMKNPEMIGKIQSIFEENVIKDNQLDRKKIAGLVFSSPEKLQQLNNIVHPAVLNHFENWLKENSNHPFVIKEAAILFESGSYKSCDKIILVTAPEEIRIQRVMNRDTVDEQHVRERIKSQWSDEKKAQLSDYIIENIELHDAKLKVLKILKELNKM